MLRRAILTGAFAAVLVIITVSPGGAGDPTGPLDPYAATFQLRLHSDCPGEIGGDQCGSGVRTQLENRGLAVRRTFGQVYANLNADSSAACPIRADQVGFPIAQEVCFTDTGVPRTHWLSEGLAGSHEFRTAASPAGTERFLVATWCYRATATSDATCRPVNDDGTIGSGTETRSRISLIGLSGPGAGKYRHIELTIPRRSGTTYSNARLRIHAGGAGIAGQYLYVADTDKVYVFDLGYFYAANNEYTLPAIYWFDVIAPTGVSPKIVSSLSIDPTGTRPHLVTAQYLLSHTTGDGRADVVRFPMTLDGRMLVAASGRVTSDAAYEIDNDSDIGKVQGVAASGSTYLFSSSFPYIDRTRVSPHTRPASAKCILWGRDVDESAALHQAQDLYSSPSTNRLWGINEYPQYRSIWSVSYNYAFGVDGSFAPRTCASDPA